jgi:hypothetical protein
MELVTVTCNKDELMKAQQKGSSMHDANKPLLKAVTRTGATATNGSQWEQTKTTMDMDLSRVRLLTLPVCADTSSQKHGRVNGTR